MAKMGRPSTYKPEYAKMIVDYFDKEAYKINKKGRKIANDLPLKSGFAKSIGVYSEIISRWAKQHEDFAQALKKAEDSQKRILVTNGLNGLYDKTFAIFTAKNIIGWRDKQEISGSDGGPIEVSVVGEYLSKPSKGE